MNKNILILKIHKNTRETEEIKDKDKYINMNIYQKGQTLLFVIVGVTIALAIGIAVSTRTLSSLRRAARSDTSARVIAAAEAGIENLLSKPDGVLMAASNPSESSCQGIGATYNNELKSCAYILSTGSVDGGSQESQPPQPSCTCSWHEASSCGKLGCLETQKSYLYTCKPVGCGPSRSECRDVVECSGGIQQDDPQPPVEPGTGDGTPHPEKPPETIQPITSPTEVMGASDQAGDQIPSRAVVSISTFNSDEGSDGYSFTLSPGNVKEIVLDGYTPNTLTLCFNNPNTAIYYFSYNRSGETLKSGIYPNTSFPYSNNLKRFQSSGGSANGYTYCSDISLIQDNKYGLRLKALYEESKVAVFPTSGNHLPTQGFLFVSRGELSTGKGSDEVATVKVRKSYSYVPDIFDFGIYTTSDLSGIGN